MLAIGAGGLEVALAIANMGAELGATTTVFPSDDETRRFLRSEGREADWSELTADDDATYDRVSFDVDPTSRQTLEVLASESYLLKLIGAGARLHQASCNGCIGMGQAPASGTISLRTVPRNFPGRSGTPGATRASTGRT